MISVRDLTAFAAFLGYAVAVVAVVSRLQGLA